MKKDIHPKYDKAVEAKCACGAEYKVGSTRNAISVEICRKCHPFYTGADKVMDTAGRVEKFKTRMAASTKAKKTSK